MARQKHSSIPKTPVSAAPVAVKAPVVRLPDLATQVTERVYGWRRKAATAGMGALAVMMGYGVVFGHNGLTAFEHKRMEAQSLQRQMQELKTENERLLGHVDRLQKDPGAIEHQAREELHYTRSGEVIYTLPPSAGAAGSKPVSNP